MKLPAPNETQKIGRRTRGDDVTLAISLLVFVAAGVAMIVVALR